MLEWLFVLLLPIITAYLIYRWSIATFDYFLIREIPFVPPYPFFGGLWPVFRRQLHPSDAAVRGYAMFPERRFSGYFTFRQPGWLIHDPALVKQICIKDFDHFTDHMNEISADVDPMFGRAAFFMNGQRWRNARSAMSPAFTGSKMRNMCGLVSKCVRDAMWRLAEKADGEPMQVELRDLFQKLGNDVMTSVCFGVEIDSLLDPNNEFLLRGKQLTASGAFQGLKHFSSMVVPESVFKFLGIRFLPEEAANFYVDVVSKTIQHREKNNIIRPDFIHLFVQARKNELKEDRTDESLKSAGFTTVEEHIQSSTESGFHSDMDIGAVAASFIFSGIETSSPMLCYAVYELALNPSIQKKLQAEIDATNEQLAGGDYLTYETLQKMAYLDMVVTEALRRAPPIGVTNRVCVKSYSFEDFDGTKVTVEKGQSVQIPIVSFHHDPNFFPDPFRFDPERFSEENKHKIDQNAFLPFGSGPRNCVGSRLALVQIKCMLYYLLENFDVELSDNMTDADKLDERSLSFHSWYGVWFRLVPRVSKSGNTETNVA